MSPQLSEDAVWRDDVSKVLGEMPDNVVGIWQYGFTEMFNNAIDHSAGKEIYVRIKKTAVDTEVAVMDDGIGIFKKIQGELNLLDERHAILELAKGKLTTDPRNHSGEGIFFSSRMFDGFDILWVASTSSTSLMIHLIGCRRRGALAPVLRFGWR